MEELNSMTVREIALKNPVSTRVFEEFRIDYCCGGRRLLDEACELAGVPTDIVERRLDEALVQTDGESVTNFADVPLGELVDHILERHHKYTRSEMSALMPLMAKVADRHGELHTELLELKELVRGLFEDLGSHMTKEEAVLFPYVRNIAARDGRISGVAPAVGSIRSPIKVMMAEHDIAGDILRKMRSITRNYELPEGACPSYTALYSRLELLEKDLHTHIHLENNILFPKSLELEAATYPLIMD